MRWIAVLVVACSRPSPREESASGAPSAPATTSIDATLVGAVADAPPVDAPIDAPPVAVVDAPMKWSDRRAALTLEYRHEHSDPKATNLDISPRVVVLHYTGGNSAAGTREYFDNLLMEAARPELLRAGKVNVSSHYVIDRDGTIYKLQPETRFARHCIGLNHISIGIENVGDGSRYPLTDAQVTANAALVRELAGRFPITHLLGHHEVDEFRKTKHAYYLELDPKYRNAKPDPGAAFMKRVRAKLSDLSLAGVASPP